MSDPIKKQAGTTASDGPPAEIKQLYRTAYGLVKDLDDQRRAATNADALFEAGAQSARDQLVRHADTLIFQPHTLVGRKAREILWRKCYYDVIANAKRHWAQSGGASSAANNGVAREALALLIDEGIRTYKQVVVRMNSYFKLDLGYLVDLPELHTAVADSNTDHQDDTAAGTADGQFSLELISYGLETVHAALLSLGDLHRYKIDLQLAEPRHLQRADAARFYHDAFKLNTKVGMAQNQLGTLYSGQTHELDAVYHYLYSLICPVPFELSECNVAKVFAANAGELQRLGADGRDEVTLSAFLVRFKRLAQICFYDRQQHGEHTELQTLGHRTLCDLRELLARGGRNGQLTADGWFKVVAVLLFGVHRLLAANSQTVHTLNALLVAVCAELVDAANASVERLLAVRLEQREAFGEQYGALYELFDRSVRMNRKAHKENDAMLNGEEEMKVVSRAVGPAAGAVNRRNGINGVGAAGKPSSSSLSGASGTSAKDGYDSVALSTPGSNKERGKSGMMAPPISGADKSAKKKKVTKVRGRRRRRFSSDDSDDDDDVNNSDAAGLSDSDVDSNDSDESDFELDSDFSSDSSSAEEEAENGANDDDEDVADAPHKATDNRHIMSDSDMSIEGEHFVYPNGTEVEPLESLLLQFLQVSDGAPHVVDGSNNDPPVSASVASDAPQSPTVASAGVADAGALHDKLRYKRRYAKPDPNIIVEFAQHDCTLRALKVLFDWLLANPELLVNCNATNPEFVHKIMRLINHLNIDVFTRKVFFDRTMLRIGDVRTDLEHLFGVRANVPLAEDALLKDFAVLQVGQQQLDWELPLRERLTANEEHLLRMFKLVDFGFYLSKTKQLGYRFCARTRMFVSATSGSVAGNGQQRNGGVHRRGPHVGGGGGAVRRLRHITRKQRMAQMADGSHRNRPMAVSGATDSYTSNEENELVARSKFGKSAQGPRKSYLKSRNHNGNVTGGSTDPAIVTAAATNGGGTPADVDFPALTAAVASTGQNKFEIMGKLWLRNEVKTLESEVGRKPAMHALTPFVVVDASALTDGATIVKILIKSKKFVVLVPSAVLSELDHMKKSSEAARNAIRWLEAEISKGSRHLRMQRSYETQSIAMLKTPRKLDRDDFNFLQIAQFCNYMQASHADDTQLGGGGAVLTLLTGVDLAQRRSTASPPLSYTGVMHAIAVHFEPIAAFYAKYKNK